MSDFWQKFFATIILAVIFGLVTAIIGSCLTVLPSNSEQIDVNVSGEAKTHQFMVVSEIPATITFSHCGGDKFLLALQDGPTIKGEYVKPSNGIPDPTGPCWEKTITDFMGQILVVRGPVNYKIQDAPEPVKVHVYFTSHSYWLVFWKWLGWAFLGWFVFIGLCMTQVE